MTTNFKSSFLNDIKKINDRKVDAGIKQALLSVENATTMQDIPNLKKLKGFKNGNYYRIKVGDFRIGVAIENETVTFVAFDNRKDIYKNFP